MQNFHHSIFITQFPSLITHHFKILHPFGTITQLPSLNIFHIICRPHTCHSVQFFFSFLVPRNPNQKGKKEKEKEKKPRNPNPGEERKKKKKKKRKTPETKPRKKKKKKKW